MARLGASAALMSAGTLPPTRPSPDALHREEGLRRELHDRDNYRLQGREERQDEHSSPDRSGWRDRSRIPRLLRVTGALGTALPPLLVGVAAAPPLSACLPYHPNVRLSRLPPLSASMCLPMRLPRMPRPVRAPLVVSG